MEGNDLKMLLLGKEFQMSSTDVDDPSQEMDHCKNTKTNMYTKIVNILEKYRYTALAGSEMA